MIDATTYLPTVAWVTTVKDVMRISEYDYQFTAIPSDPYEPGAGQKEVGYIVIDFIGNIYPITAVDGNNILVNDVMKCGWCPQIGRNAIISKQVGNSLFLSPIHYEYLDKQAFGKMYGINLAEIDKNKGDIDTIMPISRSVSQPFKKVYSSIPVGFVNVYRIVEEEPGKPVRQTALSHSLSITTDGFTLQIDESEDLTGIFIYYNFNSAT